MISVRGSAAASGGQAGPRRPGVGFGPGISVCAGVHRVSGVAGTGKLEPQTMPGGRPVSDFPEFDHCLTALGCVHQSDPIQQTKGPI